MNKEIIKNLTVLLTLIIGIFGAKAQNFVVTGLEFSVIGENEVEVVGTYNDSFDSSLASIEIPSSVSFNGVTYSVTSIAEKAFYGYDLGEVSIPNSIKTVGDKAFYGCEYLHTVNIGSGLKNLGSYVFVCCYQLKDIKVVSDNPYFCDIDGVLYNKDLTTIYTCPIRKINIELPSSLTEIGSCAFWFCRNLTKIELPESVTKFGDSSFSGCTSITNIEIPESITIIPENCFQDCIGLKGIELSSVTKICKGAFYQCSSLEKVTLSKDLTEIEFGAFYTQTLKDIYCPSNIPPILAPTTPEMHYYDLNEMCSVFTNTTFENATLHVPSENIEAYKSAFGWSIFKNIISYDFNNVTFILDKSNFEKVTIYNLDGIKIDKTLENLTQGIYIINDGTNKKKILIK